MCIVIYERRGNNANFYLAYEYAQKRSQAGRGPAKKEGAPE
jgi:hypothetical protein